MEKQYKIVIDALGSDKGPEAIILGVSMALKEFPNLSITLVGPEGLINEKIKELGIDQSRLKIIPAEETITNYENPYTGIMNKPQASLVQAMKEVGKDDEDYAGMITAGSSGAILMGSFRFLADENKTRPCMAAILPNGKGSYTALVDTGATIDCSSSQLHSFAKLGSDMKKPDATTIITRDNFKTVVWPLPVSDLFGVGRRTYEKLKQQFIYTIGDLANTKKERLKNLFGKNGIYLYEAANGLENDEVQKYDELDEVKSISHGITTVKDLENDDEVWEVMLELAQEIGYKLRSKELRANGVYVSIRDDKLFWEQYQKRLRSSEQSAINIAKYAFKLFKERYDWERNIRTVTIGVTNLSSEDKPEQLSVFDCIENKSKIEKAEKVMEELNLRYGEEVVKNATLMKNDNLPNSRRKMKYNGEK